MKKFRFLSVFFTLFTMCIALCSCDSKGNKVTKEQWEVAAEGNYSNVTITESRITTVDLLLRQIEETGKYDVISEADFETLSNSKDVRLKSIVEYKYNEEYYYNKTGMSELLNTSVKMNNKAPIECIVLNSSIAEGKINAEGFSNYKIEFDANFNPIENREWNKSVIMIKECSDFYDSNIGEFDDYEFDSSKGCYTYTKEYKFTDLTGKEIVTSKLVKEVYFNGDKLSKISFCDYFTESYNNSLNNPGAFPKEDDKFVWAGERIYEFKDYGKTKIELPDDVKNLIEE